MIAVTQNTEERLIALLDSMKGNMAGLRVIHLQLSLFEGDAPEPKKLAGIIDGVIKNDEARIMFCADGDVFIIAGGLNLELFEKLKLHIATFLDVASGSLKADLYEPRKDWSVISILCEAKLKAISDARHAAKELAADLSTARKNDSFLNIKIEEELIAAFKASRKNRTRSEILVVEDDMFSRKLVTGSLSKEYSVQGVKDGKEAVRQYALHGPDVMFLDIELPDVTGHEVLKKIRSFDPDAYIVMLSGKGDKDNILRAVQAGAKGFVGKPFTKEKLLQYISQCPTIKTTITT